MSQPPPPPGPPANAQRSPVIGLIGAAGVGKSTLIWNIETALLACKWNPNPVASNAVEDGPAAQQQGAADRRHEAVNTRAVQRKHFPPKTQVSDRYHSRIISAVRQADPTDTFVLRLSDPPGELLEPGYAARDPARSAIFDRGLSQLLNDMSGCQAFVVLLDPTQNEGVLRADWKSVHYLLGRNSSMLRGNRLKGRTAIMFSKTDALPWQRRHRQRLADGWVESTMNGLYGDIIGQCEQARFFFCSTTGWVRGMPNFGVVVRPKELDFVRRKARLARINAELIATQTNLQAAREQKSETAIREALDRLQYLEALMRYELAAEQGGEVAPDPAVPVDPAGTSATRRQTAPILPLFTDPLRLVEREIEAELVAHNIVPYGVIEMPARDDRGTNSSIAGPSGGEWVPWNLAEPILWTVGRWNPDLNCPAREPQEALLEEAL